MTPLAALILAVTVSGIGAPIAVTGIHGELNEDTDGVNVVGRHQQTWSREPARTSGIGWPPAQERSQEPPDTQTRDEEPCFPRIRNIDGVDQPGHVCPDAEGTLLWIPDTETDPAGPGGAEVPPLVVTAEDVQTLLINAGTIQVQPDRSWVLVNAETIVHTDAAEHTLSTQVLGIGVDVRVTPTQFTWDFGDGSDPLVRTEPGAPWPDHTTAHRYQSVGDFQITLRTEWDAHFRAQGASTWQPVTGTPVTVAESEPFEAVTATPRLTR